MAQPIQSNTATGVRSNPGGDVQKSVRAWGEKIFCLMDAAAPPSLFSRKGLYGTLMDWAMRDEHFKTQLFRFVDVLPALTSAAEVTRHLKEYLDNDQVNLSPALRAALKTVGVTGGLFGGGIKSRVAGMARLFMIGNDEREIVATLHQLREQGIAFTVDILGEAVVSEPEADFYAQRYLNLINLLPRETSRCGAPCKSDVTPRGEVP